MRKVFDHITEKPDQGSEESDLLKEVLSSQRIICSGQKKADLVKGQLNLI